MRIDSTSYNPITSWLPWAMGCIAFLIALLSISLTLHFYYTQEQQQPASRLTQNILNKIAEPPRHDRLLEHQRWLESLLFNHRKLQVKLENTAPKTIAYHLLQGESALQRQLQTVRNAINESDTSSPNLDLSSYTFHLLSANNVLALHQKDALPLNLWPIVQGGGIAVLALLTFLGFRKINKLRVQGEIKQLAAIEHWRHIEKYSSPARLELSNRGKVLNANDQAVALFQLTKKQLLRSNIENLMQHSKGEYVLFALQGCLDQAPSMDFKGLRSSDRPFTCKVSIHPIANPALGRWLLLIDDASSLDSASERSIQHQKMEALGQLTGGIAHDFNNLLHIIIGNLNLLKEDLELDNDEDKLELLIDALSAANDGGNLTDQLLSFSRKQALKSDDVDLAPLLTNACKLASRATGGRIQVQHRLNSKDCLVNLDPSQFQNAILNLAINARDAMPNGGTITISSDSINLNLDNIHRQKLQLSPGNYVKITLCDTGSGMSKDIAQQVFDPFFTTKEPGQGTGMGLSMVYGFARQSEGDVTIDSSPGKGTQVSLYLPIVEASSQINPLPVSRKHDYAPRGVGHVLLVEDEHRVRNFAQKCLRQLGYDVTEAKTADEAHQMLTQSDHGFDILFCDMIMPGELDGPKLANWVNKNRPELQVLMTTGFNELTHGDENHPARGLLDNTSVLHKPYTKEQLAQSLINIQAPLQTG